MLAFLDFTKKVASPEQAQATRYLIHKALRSRYVDNIAQQCHRAAH